MLATPCIHVHGVELMQSLTCCLIHLLDPGVHFHAGLSDCKAIIGEAAELECKLSSEECVGIWYKDGNEVSSGLNVVIMNHTGFYAMAVIL